jgi:predicted transcriptional regulator
LASNLEVCLSIIQILEKNGPQTQDKIDITITKKAQMITKYLDLLIEQRLIEKTTKHNNQETYANTERGKRVLDFFHV